jgi:hypothetical protein
VTSAQRSDSLVDYARRAADHLKDQALPDLLDGRAQWPQVRL